MYTKFIRSDMMIDRKLYQRILDKKRRLDRCRPISPAILQRLKERIAIEWTYNSNAIEGSSLTLKETQLAIEAGLTIKGKPLREHLEAVNHKEAIDYVGALVEGKKLPSTEVACEIHRLILTRIDDENAGRYRNVNVRITGSTYLPPDSRKVPRLMKVFDNWLRTAPKKLNPVDYASLAHFKLVDIHPFVDGNGRTARLLMNLILMKEGFPPTVILNSERGKYYDVLETAHRQNYQPFVNFVGRSLERSLVVWLQSVEPTEKRKEDLEFVPLREIAGQTPYSQEYLGLLARQEKIEAVKLNRIWHTTPKAVQEYINSLDRG